MTTTNTNMLIRNLAREAGAKQRKTGDFGQLLLFAVAGALALALGIIALAFHDRLTLAATLLHPAFWRKLFMLTLLAAGGFAITRHQGIPGSSRHTLMALLPGLALPFFWALLAPGKEPVLGWDGTSAPECFLAIAGASIPALIIILLVMRRAVVTSPTSAGAAAGLLAGTLGGAAYAMACRNDGALFILVWYGLGIFTMCLAGAAAGRRFLHW
jgi:hypothetical protein